MEIIKKRALVLEEKYKNDRTVIERIKEAATAKQASTSFPPSQDIKGKKQGSF